jgi:uncharacterized protein YbbC (DUF1343 family)/CubicO group peptidase (beta-lactamase class C family)
VLLTLALTLLPQAQVEPFDAALESAVRELVEAAIADGDLPGAVIAYSVEGGPVHALAIGDRTVEPAAPLTIDTRFDLASLTKPIATSTAVALLVDRGQLSFETPLVDVWPAAGKDEPGVRLSHCLLHTTGYVPDTALSEYLDGPELAKQRLAETRPAEPLGERFRYSDVGFQLLGYVVEEVSGQSLDAFCTEQIFEPLGLDSLRYKPDPALGPIAPTEPDGEGSFFHGTVHDPRARAVGGVAGHAGLFGSAPDLVRFGKWVANQGRTATGEALLSGGTWEAWTRPREVPHPSGPTWRALGWDVQSPFSSNRGTQLSARAIGHSGFTGTSLWIDPESGLVVTCLSSRLYPDGDGTANRLWGRVVDTIQQNVVVPYDLIVHGKTPEFDERQNRRREYLEGRPGNGIDRLLAEQCRPVAGRRVGLLTHGAGKTLDGRRSIDALVASKQLEVVRLFSPEHGLESALDQEHIESGSDAASALEIVSLYGDRRRPTPEDLAGLDALLVDLQDVGMRCYTYASTVKECLIACAGAGLPVVVLDRENPLGPHPDGPALEPGQEDFVAYHTIPFVHGASIGELCRLMVTELDLDLELFVVPRQSRRLGPDPRHPWVPPSPNLPSREATNLYPALVAWEFTNLSVGRGTPMPFQRVGAPWVDGQALFQALAEASSDARSRVGGPLEFQPASSRFEGEPCEGVWLRGPSSFRALDFSLQLYGALARLYPEDWDRSRADRLLKSQRTLELLDAGAPLSEIRASWRPGQEAYLKRLAPYALYTQPRELP